MNTKLNRLFQVLLSISFALIIIVSASKFTLNFRSLYYYDIDYLKIESMSNLSINEIKKNYDYVIDYLNEDKNIEFKLPSLPSSKYGVVHFKEVKNIFDLLDKLLVICIIISVISIFLIEKNILILKHVSTALFAIPLIIMGAFLINFDASFTIFHKVFFRNDYWIFDPNYDPIINILPQEFFFHAVILILSIVILVSILLRIIYFKLNKKEAVSVEVSFQNKNLQL
ncbi:TIGR01906 family membrane protein [Clostridium bovifaecis]|uniref:TIGR01906 family membrane protein n=1 Tax=Clostridium bovifaecis TaxID=2184719 RepID=A0A6I6F628_9CLOT|nr:TIGR01906 family membrane protein [Clostridium bovifaecis]